MKSLLFIVVLSIVNTVFLSTEGKCTRFPPEGLGPLFTFGHTVLPKGTKIVDEVVLHYGFSEHDATISLTEYYYSVTDRLTVSALLPIFSQEPAEGTKGSKTGLADILLHANYALYERRKKDEYRYRIITRLGVRLPTSTVAQKTFYTFDTTNFFFGISEDAMTNDWGCYADFGTIIPTKRKGTRFGNIFLNNLGFGRIKCYNNKLYLTAYLELSHFYSRPNSVNGKKDLTSGELIVLFGPSGRMEYIVKSDPFQSLLIQLGCQYVVGHRTRVEPANKIRYVLAGLIGYIF